MCFCCYECNEIMKQISTVLERNEGKTLLNYFTLPLTGAGSRLCVVSGASDVLICSCRHPESGSTPARNEAMVRMIGTSSFSHVVVISSYRNILNQFLCNTYKVLI